MTKNILSVIGAIALIGAVLSVAFETGRDYQTKEITTKYECIPRNN